VRTAFNLLLWQYGDAAYLVSNFVGGEYAHRDHRGDPGGRDPLVPVQAARQRKALEFLQDHILSDKYFKFPPQLLRRLAVERWYHWGSDSFFSSVDFPLHDRLLGIQRIVLGRLLDPGVLSRIQNIALKTESEEQPLSVAEVFRGLTNGVWGEYPVKGAGDVKRQVKSSVIRRNLQREHLKELSTLVLGQRSSGGFVIYFGRGPGRVPPDARSLARMHLREIQERITVALNEKNAVDETTRAHLEEARERIGRVLSASLQINEP
jgi:hypothetical protein